MPSLDPWDERDIYMKTYENHKKSSKFREIYEMAPMGFLFICQIRKRDEFLASYSLVSDSVMIPCVFSDAVHGKILNVVPLDGEVCNSMRSKILRPKNEWWKNAWDHLGSKNMVQLQQIIRNENLQWPTMSHLSNGVQKRISNTFRYIKQVLHV